ncbi:MAG TPA: hypothetical protein VNV42_16575 [Solirubrobacteraceae bacterium]|jgi:hypothetical protein|nr:hypothetical protein [Solirubrobacteraceae bacterium]
MITSSAAIRDLQVELEEAIHHDLTHRTRRRKIFRGVGLSVPAVVAAGGVAMAATGTFTNTTSQLELPSGIKIQAVDSSPEFVGTASPTGFVTGSGRGGRYVYHVTGGEAPAFGCGPSDPHPTNNIYIISTLPLASELILSLLLPNGELKPSDMAMKLEENVAGVVSTSNGCPTPGIAGQPGTHGTPAEPGKAGVAVPTSTTTKIILPKATAPAAP